MQLFVHTIRNALLAIDPATNFVDSSPSNQVKGVDPYAKRCAPFPLFSTQCHCQNIPSGL